MDELSDTANPEGSIPAPSESEGAPREDSSSAQVQTSSPDASASSNETEPTLGGTRTAQLATLAEQADIR